MANNKYFFTYGNGHLFLKLKGRCTYLDSIDLKEFFDKILGVERHCNLIIDLTEATYLDSTNLGLLVKFGIYQLKNNLEKGTVLSTNNEITDTIIGMGLNQVFNIVTSENEEEVIYDPVSNSAKPNEKELKSILLECHKNLVELSEENEKKFRDVITLLENEADS